MRKKIIKYISGLLAVVFLLATALHVMAESAVFKNYGLTEPYSGSIEATVMATPQGQTGESKPVEMEFTVYQVWSLYEDGTFDLHAPFRSVKDSSGRVADLADLATDTPAATSSALCEEFAAVANADHAAPYTQFTIKEDEGFSGYGEPESGIVASDENGKFKIEGLAYGGYLFVPESSVTISGENGETTTFYGNPFLVTVPIKEMNGSDSSAAVYVDEVNATVKLTSNYLGYKPTKVKLSKVDLGGNELEGAQLVVYIRDTNTVATDQLTGTPAQWTSGKTAKEIGLGAGIYRMVETAPPANYYPAQEIYFRVNADGTVDIVSDVHGDTITGNAKLLDGSSLPGVGNGEDVSRIIMVDEPIPEQTLSTTVVAAGSVRGTASAAARVEIQRPGQREITTSVQDIVSYTGLVGGNSYSLTGTLYELDTTTSTPTIVREIAKRENVTVTANAADGEWTMDFGDVTLEADKTYVVFERAVGRDRSNQELVISHEDVNDTAQQITVTAVNPATETPTPTPSETPEETPTETPEITPPPGGGTIPPGSQSKSRSSLSPVRTGDDTNNLPWIMLLAAAAIVLIIIGVVRKRRKDQEVE